MLKNKTNKMISPLYRWIVLLLMCIQFDLNGQDCAAFFEKGQAYDKVHQTVSNMCFRRYPEPLIDSLPGVFRTKYIVSFEKGVEAYNIFFYFYKHTDSVAVKTTNLFSGFTENRGVKFSKNGSIRMVKNFMCNDTTISTADTLATIFTIPDVERPFVILNYLGISASDLFLKFEIPNSEKLALHNKESFEYYRRQDSIALAEKAEKERKRLRNLLIDSILDAMVTSCQHYTDSIAAIRRLHLVDGYVAEADSLLNQEFKVNLDPLVRNQLMDSIKCSVLDNQFYSTFICDTSGLIDLTKVEIDTAKSKGSDWVFKPQNLGFYNKLKQLRFRNRIDTYSHPTLQLEIDAKCNSSVAFFNGENITDEEFRKYSNARAKINGFIEPLLIQQLVKVPTKYTYTFYYKSSVTKEDWLCNVTREGSLDVLDKRTKTSVSKALLHSFHRKLYKPGKKKYKVQLCKFYFNGVLIGEDVLSDE